MLLLCAWHLFWHLFLLTPPVVGPLCDTDLPADLRYGLTLRKRNLSLSQLRDDLLYRVPLRSHFFPPFLPVQRRESLS